MDLARVKYLSNVDVDYNGIKVCLEMQKATGWSQEYIEHIDHAFFHAGFPVYNKPYALQNVAAWMSNLDSVELYYLDFFSKLPCYWRGNLHEK